MIYVKYYEHDEIDVIGGYFVGTSHDGILMVERDSNIDNVQSMLYFLSQNLDYQVQVNELAFSFS